jgi:cell division septal protein FtsQ
MNYLQKRREKKKMRVFYGRIRAIFKLFFAVLWGILLWEMVHSSLWVFNPPTYTLETSRAVQSAQLKGLVQQWAGKPLYAVDTGKLAQQIEKRFDLVDRAVVRRQLFPASLTIQLFEKHPWAQLYEPDTYDAFQKKAAERAKQAAAKAAHASEPGAAKPESPMLLKPYAVAAGDALISMGPYRYDPTLFTKTEKVLIAPKTKVSLDYLRRLRELAWQARQIPGFHLEVVDIRNPQRILFRFQEVPVILGALNNSATERLSRLAPLKGKVQEYRDVIESVDLQWEEQVTFHKRPNAQLKKPRTEPIQG